MTRTKFAGKPQKLIKDSADEMDRTITGRVLMRNQLERTMILGNRNAELCCYLVFVDGNLMKI